MNKETELYEGIVVNSLFESSENNLRNRNSQFTIKVKSTSAKKIPNEKRKIPSISTKELYACVKA